MLHVSIPRGTIISDLYQSNISQNRTSNVRVYTYYKDIKIRKVKMQAICFVMDPWYTIFSRLPAYVWKVESVLSKYPEEMKRKYLNVSKLYLSFSL